MTRTHYDNEAEDVSVLAGREGGSWSGHAFLTNMSCSLESSTNWAQALLRPPTPT